MVDAERVEARILRLEQTIERLDAVRAKGEAAYLADAELRAMTERWLQLAIQACIDLGAQLVSEQSVPPPSDYAGVFAALGEAGVLPDELAQRLGQAARQRNILVHLYLEIDDRSVFASLDRLDDLRQFAAVVQRLADEA
ncbi:MAG TPA: DUF86 domain-containing protein [Solirubrobacterales bacterium]|nr:DUF86 domain-containing protein [Solirubrobacterales bacterium]